MSLSDFDTAFNEQALPVLYEQFGETVSYTPPGGEAVSGVVIIPDESDREHDAGDGFGQMRSASRIWRVQQADPKLVAASVDPAKGGVFTRSDGQRCRIDGAPRDDNGEWVMDMVEIG